MARDTAPLTRVHALLDQLMVQQDAPAPSAEEKRPVGSLPASPPWGLPSIP
ncbi:MAG: hypothetical protein O2890_15880 [Cyanobacteria bacterium]|nr:hypothetical protein [Cyanobacteriota bacterium]